MNIKKLQRYRINNCADIADDKGGYCDSADVTELEATNAELVKALEETLRFLEDMHTEPTNATIQRSVEFKAEICDILASARGD